MKETAIQSLPILVVETRVEADRAVAREIEALVRAKPTAVLGLATGNTPIGVYAELVRLHRDEGLDFSGVVTFNLDEYVGLPPGHARTFRRWMCDRFFDHVNVAPENIHMPDGGLPPERSVDVCARYESAIKSAGGIDLLILGIGRNGHIGFNEPGSARDSRTRVVGLAPMTRADAVTTFGSMDEVPKQAITMGVATILDARAIRTMAFGPSKAAIVARTLSEPIGSGLPATYLRCHAHVTLHLDRDAAAGIGV